MLSGSLLYKCKEASVINSPIKIPFPKDNPISKTKVELGRMLFFDKRLSSDNTVSCANCHNPNFAFTDRRKKSQGVNQQTTQRNSPSILNSAFLETVMFDAHIPTLEMQVIVPIQEHSEMNMNMKELIPKLKAIPEYQQMAKEVFNREFDAWVLTRSISAFERTLISLNSAFDKYQKGDKNALNKQEVKGWKLFSNKLYCISCHPAPYFTTHKAANNGLYKDYGEDKGRFRIFNDSSDIGMFKIPSLRNIELTYPYMHDGSISKLEDVISHYENGGMQHKNQDSIIKPFEINSKEKQQLIAFLKCLSDTTYLERLIE
ncbi:MAG: cytochrome c peroxidase [Crocinitomicaceae bacterium]|nr:cytochrome c peroxidase [Crocinitomicaceae bacterium]